MNKHPITQAAAGKSNKSRLLREFYVTGLLVFSRYVWLMVPSVCAVYGKAMR
jgi:hypothetical protein